VNAGPPIVAGGAVWAIDRDSGQLSGHELSSGRALGTAGLGATAGFPTPAASGSLLVAPAGSQVVAFRGS
jgi:hypothetical protein